MESKKCNTCDRTLPVNEFYFRYDTKDWSTECKACRKARSSKRYAANKDRHNALVKRRYDTFGRFARYGLTPEQYGVLLTAQGGKCALCGGDKPGGKHIWHIDHANPTHERPTRFKVCSAESVRGLLCHRCNIALGHYEQLVKRVGYERVEEYRERGCLDVAQKLSTAERTGRAALGGDATP